MTTLIERVREILVSSRSLTGGVIVFHYSKPSEGEVIKKTLLSLFSNQLYPENETQVIDMIEMLNTPSRIKYFREKGRMDNCIYFVLLLTHPDKRSVSKCLSQSDIYLKGSVVYEKLHFSFIKIKECTGHTKRLINVPINIAASF